MPRGDLSIVSIHAGTLSRGRLITVTASLPPVTLLLPLDVQTSRKDGGSPRFVVRGFEFADPLPKYFDHVLPIAD
jgi:hypothetical protein